MTNAAQVTIQPRSKLGDVEALDAAGEVIRCPFISAQQAEQATYYRLMVCAVIAFAYDRTEELTTDKQTS